MTEKMLLLGQDTITRNVLLYCKDNGIHSIVTDHLPFETSPMKQLVDEAWMIDVKDLDKLEKKCRDEGVTSVFAGNHELLIDTQRKLCKRLSLPYFSSDRAWSCTKNKGEFKSLCKIAWNSGSKTVPP